MLSLSAHASAKVTYAEIIATDDSYVVNADIDLTLNDSLIDALNRGIALHFNAEFIIDQPRWYWLDRSIAQRQLRYKLTYHAITRNYRLSIGSLHHSYNSLNEALSVMKHIKNWHILPRQGLSPGESYYASIRFRFDTSMLPKPFQVTTIGSNDWYLSSDWYDWTFLASPIQ